jgi:hypothetical protein
MAGPAGASETGGHGLAVQRSGYACKLRAVRAEDLLHQPDGGCYLSNYYVSER